MKDTFYLFSHIKKAAKQHAHKPLLTFLHYKDENLIENTLSYDQVYEKSVGFSDYLAANGAKRGDRALIVTTQTPDNIIAIYACLKAGILFTIVPPPVDPGKLERFISVTRDFSPKFIISNNVIKQVNSNALAVSFSDMLYTDLSIDGSKGCCILKIAANDFVLEGADCENSAYVVYSSGSTNNPKGVVVSQKNIYHQVEKLEVAVEKEDRADVCVAWAPIFHNMGIINICFYPVLANVHTYVMSPRDFVENPVRWFEAISKYKANTILAPNSVYELCAHIISTEQAGHFDLSSVKIASNGSEPVHVSTLHNFFEKFKHAGFRKEAFYIGYGLSETTCVAATRKYRDSFKTIDMKAFKNNLFIPMEKSENSESARDIVSCGRPLEGVHIQIVNPGSNKPAAENEMGEICINGDLNVLGYLNLPDETQNTFKSTIPGIEGHFLRTGDMGIMFEGDLYVTGRIKEMMIINGHNVYPNDIAQLLKKNVPELRFSQIACFSSTIRSTENQKEQVIICIEGAGESNYSDIGLTISTLLSNSYEFSPYDILFMEKGTFPRTDNGKIKVLTGKKLYDENKLPFLFSTRDSFFKKETKKDSKSRTAAGITGDEKRLLSLVKKALHISTDIDLHDNLFLLGSDSLMTMHLLSLIEEEFAINVPMKYVLKNPTSASILEYIAQKRDGLVNETDERLNNALFLQNEVKLDENIHVPAYDASPAGNFFPEHIFLTGCTGFVGAYLIKDLMTSTKAALYCHVRAKTKKEGLGRIVDNLKFYNCFNDSYKNRIFPVIGDLSRPNLGIEQGEYEELSGKIEMIYHNGAILNFIYPYSMLKGTNVDGTVECIKLACNKKAKYFNYVSTFSVFDNPSHFEKTALEDSGLESPEGYFLGYSESKWVAEKIVNLAKARGLKTAIYRPGEITGTAADGIWKLSDMVSRFLVSSINTGYIPDIPVNVHMTPVDYVTGAITAISLKKSSYGKAYNIVNKNIKSISQIADCINSYGFSVESIPFARWKENLTGAGEDHELKLLQSLFFEPKKEGEEIEIRYSEREAVFDVSNTKTITDEQGLECHPMNEELIHTYLDFFKSQGHIKR